MRMKRWEWLEGVKAETTARVCVRELCKVLTSELSKWPPEVSSCDEGMAAQMEALFYQSEFVPLGRVAMAEALKRLGWEFERNLSATDFYLRNHQLENACPDIGQQRASEFAFAYLREGFYELMERTEGRVLRSDVLDGLAELGILLYRRWDCDLPL